MYNWQEQDNIDQRFSNELLCQKAIWSNLSNILQHVHRGECWIRLQIFGCLQAYKHFSEMHSYTFYSASTLPEPNIYKCKQGKAWRTMGGRQKFNYSCITRAIPERVGPLCCWVGNPMEAKQKMASEDNGKISALNHRMDKRTDKSIAKAVWLYFRERRGFGGQQVNYVTLSSYREHWERDLPGHRDLGDREIDGYQKVRKKDQNGEDDKWSLNFLKRKKRPERVLTHAFSACTTRWHQPPAVPATAAAALGRWLTQYLWVNKQR